MSDTYKAVNSLSQIFASLFFSIFSSIVCATTLNWHAPYLGIYLGTGVGNHYASTNVGGVTSTSYFTTSADTQAVNNTGTSTTTPINVIGGIQGGHDWIKQQMIYGIILDYGALPLKSSHRAVNLTYPDDSDQYSLYTSMRTNWLLTLRGRLGCQHTIYNKASLWYITGGMVITDLKVTNNFNDNSTLAGAGGSRITKNQIGWTAGLGIDLAWFNDVSVTIEYLFVDVPSVGIISSISNSQGGFGISTQSLTSPFFTKGDFYANLIKIGMNYRFDENN